MAVYKPSQFNPSLEEVDANENTTFSCQVNSSGNSILAYKMDILSLDGSETIYDGEATNLPSPVLNKGRIQIENVSNTTKGMEKMVNGKDYQWGARVYDAKISSTAQPKTLVCSGYLVGSTRYVLWTDTDNADADSLVLDRWVEFKTTDQSSFLPVPIPNSDNMVLPTGEFRQRLQISWVEKELGWDKNFIKLEMEEAFDYNYKDGTKFDIYLCSDQHTQTSVFCDPSDVIERGYYVEIWSPDGQTQVETKHKIIGYGDETGEIRVQEPFKTVPVNGQIIKIFSYDRINETYEEKTLTSSNKVGGAPIDKTFKILNNRWDDEVKQLFIQPNINIKSDKTNPNEIVFDNNNARIDINRTTSDEVVPRKTTDTTFNKLDNTQWLLTSGTTATSTTPPITPKSYYKVYTDFMDASPYSVFYARTSPDITIQFKNANEIQKSDGSYVDNPFITVEGTVAWRDITFNTVWSQIEGVEVKYYHYYIYHGTDELKSLISESDDIYEAVLEWTFRGLASGTESFPEEYTIAIDVTDQYDKKFTVESVFGVYYEIISGVIPLELSMNCNEHGVTLIPQAPVYVLSTSENDYHPTITNDSLDTAEDYIHIPAGQILNYTHVEDEEETPIVFTSDFSYFTEFQLTEDFLNAYSGGQQSIIFKIAHATKDDGTDPVEYTLKIGSLEYYYLDRTVKEYIYKSIDGAEYPNPITSADDIALISCPQENTDKMGTHADGSIWSWDGYNVIITLDGVEYTIDKTETKYTDNGVYRLNPNMLKMRLYIEGNDTPIKCFSGKDYYDLMANDAGRVLKIPEKVKYALQSSSYGTYKTYDYLPRPAQGVSYLDLDTVYMSVYDTVYYGTTYRAGVLYKWNGGTGYNAITDTEYIYIETLDQVEGATYESLGVPVNSQYSDGNTVGWKEEDGNIWVDGIVLLNQSKEYLAQKWFKFYMTVVNGTISAYVSFDDNR